MPLIQPQALNPTTATTPPTSLRNPHLAPAQLQQGDSEAWAERVPRQSHFEAYQNCGLRTEDLFRKFTVSV